MSLRVLTVRKKFISQKNKTANFGDQINVSGVNQYVLVSRTANLFACAFGKSAQKQCRGAKKHRSQCTQLHKPSVGWLRGRRSSCLDHKRPYRTLALSFFSHAKCVQQLLLLVSLRGRRFAITRLLWSDRHMCYHYSETVLPHSFKSGSNCVIWVCCINQGCSSLKYIYPP